MTFYTARDLRTKPKNIWENLSDGSELVITNNGKPTALMLRIDENNFDEVVKAVRQAKAMIAFNSMRHKAATQGFMSDEEIITEIAAYRTEKKQDAYLITGNIKHFPKDSVAVLPREFLAS